jgi:hypothetical protein
MLYVVTGAAVWGADRIARSTQLPINRTRNAKKSPVESPHRRIPIKASSGASILHDLLNTSFP